jgi:hypothetical protein
MMPKWSCFLYAAVILGSTLPADKVHAQNEKPLSMPQPALFKDVLNCRTIADPNERLACYDAKVAALDAAQAKDEIIVTDRESVKEAKRGLFGFNLPKLRIFGKEGETQLEEITAIIASARQDSSGKWTIFLEDGAKWVQIDSKPLSRDPRSGMSLRIRNASLGTFFVNVDKQTAIRMKRAN